MSWAPSGLRCVVASDEKTRRRIAASCIRANGRSVARRAACFTSGVWWHRGRQDTAWLASWVRTSGGLHDGVQGAGQGLAKGWCAARHAAGQCPDEGPAAACFDVGLDAGSLRRGEVVALLRCKGTGGNTPSLPPTLTLTQKYVSLDDAVGSWEGLDLPGLWAWDGTGLHALRYPLHWYGMVRY